MKGSGQPPLGGPKVGRHKAVETEGIQTGSQRKDAIFASPQSYRATTPANQRWKPLNLWVKICLTYFRCSVTVKEDQAGFVLSEHPYPSCTPSHPLTLAPAILSVPSERLPFPMCAHSNLFLVSAP